LLLLLLVVFLVITDPAVLSASPFGPGHTLLAKPSAVDQIDSRHLHRHLVANFLSSNMTLVGTGMEHDKVRDIVNSLFSTAPLIDADYPELRELPALDAETPTVQVRIHPFLLLLFVYSKFFYST
jgi:hypothetical protein